MPLYLVQHVHTPDKCPTKSPEMVKQLANHVTQDSAGKFGVKIVADWANDDEHTMVLVLESENREKVARFTEPFATVGSVTIKKGMTCQDIAKQCLGK